MKRRFQLILALGVAVVAAMAVYASRSSHAPLSLPPGNVTAHQISPYWHFDPVPDDRMFYQWPILDSATANPSLDASIRATFRNPAVFDPDASSKSCFDPRLALRFGSGPQMLDLAICLHCDNMQIYKSGKAVDFRNLSREGHREIEKLTYQIFPDADVKDAAANARAEEIDGQRSKPASAPTTR
ncbi:MAG: hypothetical protein H7Z14_00635 [Anaerolineae bacterium]|nr:hypothetical protein [Phycisphaerae bacterium]